MKLHKRTQNLLHRKFTRLTVVNFIGYSLINEKKKKAKWKCSCDCGNVLDVDAKHLISGKTRSCGCLQREIVSSIFRKDQGIGGFNGLFYRYKKQAKRMKRIFKLSKKIFKSLTSKNCHYCNKPPASIMTSSKSSGSSIEALENSKYIYNGIDRVDNTKGYVKDNCVSCCKDCNMLKGKYSYNEFIELVKNISKHQKFNEVL